LTTEDLRAYAEVCASAEARKLEARKSGPRPSKAPTDPSRSPWYNPLP
jgi:hypothetical protein